jgi:alkanesulfonate monooxygenase
MLQFQPFEAEMRRFAQEVIPRVRQARAGGTAGPAGRLALGI